MKNHTEPTQETPLHESAATSRPTELVATAATTITQRLERSPLLSCTAFAAAAPYVADGHLLVGRNFDFDAKAYIDKIPEERVVQIHVAGHYVREDGLRIDTHGEPVPDDVYELLDYTLRKVGAVPVLLERDNNIPPLDELLAEVDELWSIYRNATEDGNAR